MLNRIIIIDDEEYILEQLRHLIDWEKIGFEVCDVFSDTEDIYEYIENNRIDAILTDISMPEPNGLDIAKYCYEKHPDVFVVIISGYRDFSYAQQSLKYNVFDYITKPIEYDNFLNCMTKLSGEISSKKSFSSFINFDPLFELQLIFSDLANHYPVSEDELRLALISCDLPENILSYQCTFVNVFFEDFEDFLKNKWTHGRQGLYNAICNVIQRKDDPIFNIVTHFGYSSIEVIILIQNNNNFEHLLNAQIQNIAEKLEVMLRLNASVAVSKCYNCLSDILNDSPTLNDDNHHEYASSDEIIRKAYDYIKDNYQNNITLASVAKHVAMSKEYFCSYFKAHTGQTFITALNQFRIDKAKQLLKDKSNKPSAVSLTVGFSNQQHFYRVFKAFTGCTPGEYQNKVENE